MAEFPALPIWTDAYLADCSHLTDAEHGRYFLLLMAMWRAPDCRLPNDDKWLARKFSRSESDIANLFRPLISEFCQCSGNWITQKRLLQERGYVQRTSKKQSDIAKARWNKKKGVSHGNAPAGNAPTPTPTPTPIEERKDANASSSIAPASDAELIDAVAIWNAMAARNGLAQVQKLTDQRKTKLRARLAECGGIDGWTVACSKVNGNAFLTGQTGDWKADFDFMLQASRFQKLMEGGYDRTKSNHTKEPRNGFVALVVEEFDRGGNMEFAGDDHPPHDRRR